MNQTMKESLEVLTNEEAIQELLESLEEANEELKYLFEMEIIDWNEYLSQLEGYSVMVAELIQILRRENYVKVNGTQSNDDGDLLPYFREID